MKLDQKSTMQVIEAMGSFILENETGIQELVISLGDERHHLIRNGRLTLGDVTFELLAPEDVEIAAIVRLGSAKHLIHHSTRLIGPLNARRVRHLC